MAYNPIYPGGYAFQPTMAPVPNVQTIQQMPQTSGITWVQGEAGAKSYLVGPGLTVALWDSEQQTIYLKSADMSGMPTIKTIDYTIRGNESQNTNPLATNQDYMTRSEFEEFASRIQEQIDHLKFKPKYNKPYKKGGINESSVSRNES